MTRAVLHHAALPHRGGAVRVARLLMAAQAEAGLDARPSFEVAENDPERLEHLAAQASTPATPPGKHVSPGDLGRFFAALPQDALLHLHTSTDWPALLAGLAGHASARGRIVLTLHDATPLTGGCAYPLTCPHFPACAEPCPREFAEARARQDEILRLLRELAPVLVSPSAWLAGLARRVLPGLPLNIIPNGVPWLERASLPSRAQARAALGIASQARVALFAAHGGARAAYKSGPRWPYGDRARLGLLMRAADVLLYPTLADNHPLVLLEAAANELPVVSFPVGGVPEIVGHNLTGLLPEPVGDVRAFAKAALALLGDPVLARSLGQNARSRGARSFEAARMAANYAALLGL